MSSTESMPRRRLVIVGGGQAAAQLIASLQPALAGFHVTLIADEPHLPYQRPPLSKAFFDPGFEAARLAFKDDAFYREAGIDMRLGVRAIAIDRSRARIGLDDGCELDFDALVIATGARARQLNVPGSELGGVLTLRSLDDACRLAPHLRPGRRIAVVGGGYVGLEVAASARRAGMSVTVLEAGSRVLGRVASPHVARVLTDMHRAAGVTIRTGVDVVGFVSGERQDAVTGVRLADARTIDADVVVVGIGAAPNSELAESAGLTTEHGAIVVDAHGRTNDERIFAAGDCSCIDVPHLKRRMRLESVPHAIAQARAIAAQLTGDAAPAPAAPWFWSEQFDARLQMAGLAPHYDECVLREIPAANGMVSAFIEFYLDGGKLVAGAALNRPADFVALRRLLDGGAMRSVDAAALADAATPLAKALANTAVAVRHEVSP